MFRFTIRDVLWLMVVVGMGVGWMVNYSKLTAVRDHALTLRQNFKSARSHYGPLDIPPGGETRVILVTGDVDWDLADKPIP